jgi:hypothetical protein
MSPSYLGNIARAYCPLVILTGAGIFVVLVRTASSKRLNMNLLFKQDQVNHYQFEDKTPFLCRKLSARRSSTPYLFPVAKPQSP